MFATWSYMLKSQDKNLIILNKSEKCHLLHPVSVIIRKVQIQRGKDDSDIWIYSSYTN